jgi:hypothetical protein
MTYKKVAIAAALCLAGIGWSASQAQDQTYRHAGQQPDRSGQTQRGSGHNGREGSGQTQAQQGRGYNGADSYHQRGQGGHGYARGGDSSRQWRSGGHGRSGYGHSRRCRVQWRHHRRVRVCR